MTEDTSPKNLRKFLESDDPAMVQMGLSMAKGVGVPDEMLGEILWMYMMHEDKRIRVAAKSTFMKLAPDKSKEIIKKNWKSQYMRNYYHSFSPNITSVYNFSNTISNYYDAIKKPEYIHDFSKAIRPLVQAFKPQDELGKIVWRLTEPITKIVKSKSRSKEGAKQKTIATKALGNLSDIRAVETLIEVLEHPEPWWAKRVPIRFRIKFIGLGGGFPYVHLLKLKKDGTPDKRFVSPDMGWRLVSAEALGNIGDKRALLPLNTLLSQLELYFVLFGFFPNNDDFPPHRFSEYQYHRHLIKAIKKSIAKCQWGNTVGLAVYFLKHRMIHLLVLVYLFWKALEYIHEVV